jgi:hypothetical protein
MNTRATSLIRPGLAAGLLALLLTVLWLGGGGRATRAANFPTLTIPELIPAEPGQPVVVPVDFDPGLADNVNTMLFEIRYDSQLLALDPTDSNNDGRPDSIAIDVPPGFILTVNNSVSGGTGSILVTVVNFSSPLDGLAGRRLMQITFTAGSPAAPTVTDVSFATSPSPFFADKNGVTISGLFDGGSVAIGDVVLPTASPTANASPTATASPTAGPSPTATNTAVPTATRTPLPEAFYMPAVLYGFTPTPTATPIPPTATPVIPTATATSPAPTATATGAAPTATPRPPTPRPPTATPGPFCGELVLNGGMENNSGWQINLNAFPASYVTTVARSGSRSMRIGIVNPWDNRFSYSSIQQTLTIPQTARNTTLRFWLWPTTTGRTADKLQPPALVPTELSGGTLAPLADDVQMVLLFDQAGTQHVLLFQRQNFGGWAPYEMNLDRFAGQRVTLYFGVFNNGTGGITGMYLDDVSLVFCN